jgi:hypothetical protein
MSIWFYLVNGFYLFIASNLGMRGTSDLLSYVVEQGLHSRDPTISEDELVLEVMTNEQF